MLKSKRYRIIKLIIQIGDVILDSELGKKLGSGYHKPTKPTKGSNVSKLKGILDLGLRVVSKKPTKKQDEEHKKIAEENKRKFMKLWEDKYNKGSKGIDGRELLDFFENKSGDKGG